MDNDNSKLSGAELFKKGLTYYSLVATSPDSVKSAYYFQLAADKENADAQAYLSRQYQDGEGVTKDFAKAITLYQKAASNGSADAVSALQRLGKKAA